MLYEKGRKTMQKNKADERMNEIPVYFSKVEFHECFWMFRKGMPYFGDEKIIFLDLVNRELSVQVIRTGQDLSNRIYSLEAGWRIGYPNEEAKQMINIRTGKNGMKSIQVQANDMSSKVVLSKGIMLTDRQMEELLPYCNALEFEPFRNRKMSMKDPGYRGYRDEVTVWFRGITDSYIPKIELPMDYVFDEKHTWPSEKLYEYIVDKLIKPNKKLSCLKIYQKV